MVAAILFFVGWLFFLSIGFLVLLRPWIYFRVAYRFAFLPFTLSGTAPPNANDPLLSLLSRRKSLANATPEELAAWNSKMGYVRLIGLTMICVGVGLAAWILIAALIG